MTSLSNLIKATQYIPQDKLVQLNLAKHYEAEPSETGEEGLELEQDHMHRSRIEEAEQTRREILEDAKGFAERQIREASEEAQRMLDEAKQQIEAWWQDRREQDEQLIEASKAEGFHQGYTEGQEQAKHDLKEKIEAMMGEAQSILSAAQINKEQIIQEAEPFIVALSCEIAGKVIDKQLTIEPEFAIDLIKRTLSRKREQGTITLCVAPSHYAFVQAAKEELALAVDSQAELLIIPDSTVKDQGCVIRSAYGSVDARIDTQLGEIKKELLRLARHGDEQEEGVDHV